MDATPLAIAAASGHAGGLLRVMTCGSVDDGKSTLIGRLLHDTKTVFEDQISQLKLDSARHGTTGTAMDMALLVDGLEAEREQGITIDVAYRFVTTARRRLIIADSPGHEQYTRNMATAASTADVAVVLIDARRGVLTQTRRHSFIASLMGIRHIVLAVNKMDLVNFSQEVFEQIVADYREAVASGGFASIDAVPIVARDGDNVTAPSVRMPWYMGDHLLGLLETIMPETEATTGPWRLPVQWVSRPDASFRGYAGTIAAGVVAVGDAVATSGSGQVSRVARIVTMDGDLPHAAAGDAVTLVLDHEIDASRGDVLAAAENPVEVSDQFAAHVVWLASQPLQVGREYLLKLGARTVPASVTSIRHRIDVNTRQKLPATQLALNDVARIHLSTSVPLAWMAYRDSRDLGGFIVIDRQSNATAGVGMIEYALTRAANLAWHELALDRNTRASAMGQRPLVVWFTGLSGSGKSTIANLLDRKLHALGRRTYVLDGDNVRHGLNRDLGFTETDRVENIRRVSEVAALMADAGLVVIVAFISPYRAERDAARARLPAGEFIEVFVDTPLEDCEARDPKGLYAKARAGLIPNFTGISAPYEPPLAPELHLRSDGLAPEASAELVAAHIAHLEQRPGASA